jgi:glucans biosynthesis protein
MLPWAVLGASCASASEPVDQRPRFGFAAVEALARSAARRAYEPPAKPPAGLGRLDYDAYRLIAFEPQRAVWRHEDRPFRLEFFHRGYLFADEVKVRLVADNRTEPVRFDPRMFQYRGPLAELDPPADIGFAGFRVLGKFASSKNFLEIASFLGASYFRAIGEGQVYGTSARGLAIDVGLSKAEEFPAFREFWVERPSAADDSLTFWALLDSPSVAGAYQFQFRPGAASRFDVHAKLFFRRRPDKIGLAPLTSMWAWGDGLPGPAGDLRPKVHDSDGLLIHTSAGEWVWRPLGRQDYPSLCRYDFAGVRGFGLMQRDRRPESFRDDEAKYQLRPSVWIEPRGGWPAGAVELLELPGEHEGIDTIAAWWTPQQPVRLDEPLVLDYTVAFQTADPPAHDLARATALRIARPGGKSIQIEIDFRGESLFVAESNVAAIVPTVEVQRGRITVMRLEQVTAEIRRLHFTVVPESDQPVELSAMLRRGERPVSETWRYLCRAKNPR